MIDRDRKAFFTLIADVSAFYKQDFSDFAGGVWWEALKPYDFSAVADALNRHAVNPDVGQFMPKPADVVRMLQGSTQDAALVAWAKLDRAVRTVGTYRTVVFDDPLLHRVVADMGGWVMFGTKTEDEWPFLRNEFVNRYRAYRMRSETPDYPRTLIGMSEATNSKNGVAHVEAPTLIGNPEVAARVLQGGSTKPLLQVTQMSEIAANEALRLSDERAKA